MEYIKVPYVRLRGKKYGGDLTPEEAESITNFHTDTVGDGSSENYSGTFQELYKEYNSGKDPIESAPYIFSGTLNNPEKIFALHDAISAIAKKYGYNAPNPKNLSAITPGVFQKISVPNSYFIARQDYGENVLIITDNDSIPTYMALPLDIDWELQVDVDKSGNILIPKEAYDEDLEVF
jgi:hypothetical protein